MRDITEAMQLSRDSCSRGILQFPDGTFFHYGSGSERRANHPSCPLGSSSFGSLSYAPSLPGQEGYYLTGSANGYDPKVGRKRAEIMIHRARTSNPDEIASWGCIAIADNEFDAFKEKVSKMIHNGDLWLNVHPYNFITVTLYPEYDSSGGVL